MGSFAGKVRHAVRPRRFVAVDFDSRQLRVVQGERSGNHTRLRRLTAVPIPPDVEISDPRVVGVFLASALRRLKIAQSPVVMSVPRAHAVLKPLTLPPGTDLDDLAAMVQFQMAKELPFRIEEAIIDFTVGRHYDAETGADESAGVDVLVAAVKIPVVDYFQQIAAAANVKLLRLGLRPYADQGCVERCVTMAPDEQVAVVHVTADEVEIGVLSGGLLVFSRSGTTRTPPPRDLSDAPAVEEAVSALAAEVARSLQSISNVQREPAVARVLVAGGTGVEDALCERLRERLHLPCEILHAADALQLEGQGNASEFISALGLAIRSGGGRLPFDFLHPKRPTVKRDYTRVRRLAVAAVLIAAIGAGVVMGRDRLDVQREAVRDLTKTKKSLDDEVKALRKQVQRVDAVEAWVKENEDWLGRMAHVGNLFPSAADAYIRPRPGLKANGRSLAFTVRAQRSETITDLIKKLESGGYRVETERFQTTNEPDYVYTIDMKLAWPQGADPNLSAVTAVPRPPDDRPGWEGGEEAPRSGRTRR